MEIVIMTPLKMDILKMSNNCDDMVEGRRVDVQ